MDSERLIALNKYTRRDIEEMTGEKVESSVVCVGNTLERLKAENYILNHVPFMIVGTVAVGKYTSVIEICDKHDLEHVDCFDNTLFGETPFINKDTVYIIRNPKKSKLISRYIEANVRLVMLYDLMDSSTMYKLPKYGQDKLVYRPLSPQLVKKYEKIKGMRIIHNIYNRVEIDEKRLVANHLRRGNVKAEDLPPHTHRWLARNFSSSNSILIIANIAQQIKNKTIYHALMKLIKYKKSINLKFPNWVKRQ